MAVKASATISIFNVDDGATGETGVGVDKLTAYYAVGASGTTEPSAPSTTGWSTTMPTVSATQFLWLAYLVTYTDGTTAWTEPYCVTDVTTRERVTTLETDLSVVQGQITSKVWQSDIDTATNSLGEEITTIRDQYSEVIQTESAITARVADLETTADSHSAKITDLEVNVDGIKTTVSETITNLETNYATISQVEQTADSITAEVERATAAEGALKSSIQVNADNIALKVDADGVISAINLSPETATISADKINLEGAVTISSLSSEVKGAITLYGTCSTAYGTTAKVVACTDATELTDGLTVQVKFTYYSTASAPALNVNSLGAKKIYFNGAAASASNQFRWASGTTITFVYTTIDDTGYWVPQGYPRSYYGTSSTAAATTAKTTASAIADFVKCAGTSVAVKFTNANTAASPTLNVSNTGATSIYAYGSTLTSKSIYNWGAGATIGFTFDGQYWQMSSNSADAVLTSWCSANDTTYIDGSKIYTGSIMVDQIKLYGCMTVYDDETSDTVGGYLGYMAGVASWGNTDGIGMYTGTNMVVATTGGAKLMSGTDGSTNTSIYTMENKAIIISQATSGQVNITANGSGGTIALSAGVGIYTSPAISTTSDERLKTDFGTLDGYEGLFDSLDPVSYRYTNRPGKRYLGFTTQSVAAALEANGLDPEEYGLLGEWQDDNGDTYGTLAYTELIAVLWHEVQRLKKEVEGT